MAWQRADDLFVKLHLLTLKQFPSFEKFELGSHLRKAAYAGLVRSTKVDLTVSVLGAGFVIVLVFVRWFAA